MKDSKAQDLHIDTYGGTSLMFRLAPQGSLYLFVKDGRPEAEWALMGGMAPESAVTLRDALVGWYGHDASSAEGTAARDMLDKVSALLDNAEEYSNPPEDTVSDLWDLLGKSQPTPEPTVEDALNELPLRSVIKFDCDRDARYTRTRKGWKDVADGIRMAQLILDSSAGRFPFEVKYNPQEEFLGKRVTIKNTMLFNGRRGVVVPASGDTGDIWSYNVILDDGMRIGVGIENIEEDRP